MAASESAENLSRTFILIGFSVSLFSVLTTLFRHRKATFSFCVGKGHFPMLNPYVLFSYIVKTSERSRGNATSMSMYTLLFKQRNRTIQVKQIVMCCFKVFQNQNLYTSPLCYHHWSLFESLLDFYLFFSPKFYRKLTEWKGNSWPFTFNENHCSRCTLLDYVFCGRCHGFYSISSRGYSISMMFVPFERPSQKSCILEMVGHFCG